MRMILHLVHTLFSLVISCMSMIQVDLSNQTSECVQWLQEHVFYDTHLHLNEFLNLIYISFEDFTELNGMNCNLNRKIETLNLFLYSQKKILIEQNLNLTDVLNLVQFTKKLSPISMISIRNILGFNQYAPNKTKKQRLVELKDFEFYFSIVLFEFYLNKVPITKEMCQYENFNDKQINYFWPMTKIIFNYDIFYTEPVCPFVFINSNLKQMVFSRITNSFIFKNRLEFININETNTGQTRLNNLIKSLELNIVFEEVNERILNRHVFKSLKKLQIAGSPSQIQTNLFESSFNDLQYISFFIDNLKTLLHQGLDWMLYLNKKLRVNTSDAFEFASKKDRIIIVQFNEVIVQHFNNEYEYPDEDLCLFKDFPHKQLIIPSLPLLKDIQCSCTLIWLIQNVKIIYDLSFSYTKFKDDFDVYFQNFSVIYCLANFSDKFDSCQFKQKFKTCHISSKSKLNIELGVFDAFFLFEWLKLVIQVYGKSFFCILGLFTNFLIVLVTKNKSLKKTFDNVMYKHIFFNSIFNFVYCLTESISLLNICILPKGSFCSSIYKTNGAQYFKIIFVLFLGNSLRLCCNFSYFLFSISRFYISTSNNSKLFQKFEKFNLKLFYLITFCLCCLWSMFKLFEYRPNEAYSTFDKNFPYNRYDLRYCQYVDKVYSFLSLGCKIFPILNMINNVLNNILFIFVSVFIDFFLIRFANRNYERKKELLRNQFHINEALEQKKKVKKLIITNGILYFFSHMPEFSSTLLLIIYKEEMKDFCYNYFSCTEINEIFEAFIFIGICLQFFVYKHFDHNFSKSLSDLKTRVFK